jgi:hypothetical protein
MSQPNHTLPLYTPETTSLSAPNDPPEDPSDMNPIVSQWRRLASMDGRSQDFLPLLSSLITGTNRSSTTDLRGDDAKITLGALDDVSYSFSVVTTTYVVPSAQVFMDGKIPGEYERGTLRVMRTLAYNSGQVPPRYQVNLRVFSMEPDVFAHGGYADVRKGRLGDKVVAVKTLRIDRKTDTHDARKVCPAPS